MTLRAAVGIGDVIKGEHSDFPWTIVGVDCETNQVLLEWIHPDERKPEKGPK